MHFTAHSGLVEHGFCDTGGGIGLQQAGLCLAIRLAAN